MKDYEFVKSADIRGIYDAERGFLSPAQRRAIAHNVNKILNERVHSYVDHDYDFNTKCDRFTFSRPLEKEKPKETTLKEAMEIVRKHIEGEA